MEEKDNVVAENENQTQVTEDAAEAVSEEAKAEDVTTESVDGEAAEIADVENGQQEETAQESESKEEAKTAKAKKEKLKKEKVEKPKKEKTEKVKKQKENKPKEVEVESFEGLSDDEIYTKIQTEKLLKRKKTKRVATLVSLCVSFALAVCLIVLSVVPVSLKPKCLYDGFSTVTMYSGTSSFTFGENNRHDTYEEFLKLYDDSFAEPYISAIFSGSLFTYDIDELYSQNADTVIDSELRQTSKRYFRLSYETDQTFTKQSGGAYISRVANSTFDGILKFKTAYIVVNDEDGFQNTNVYIVANNYPTKSGIESHVIKVTIRANTNKIYDSWKTLKDIYDNEEA